MRTLQVVDFRALRHDFPPAVIREKFDNLCQRHTKFLRYLCVDNYNSHGSES